MGATGVALDLARERPDLLAQDHRISHSAKANTDVSFDTMGATGVALDLARDEAGTDNDPLKLSKRYFRWWVTGCP